MILAEQFFNGRAFCCQFVDNCSGKDFLPTMLLLNEILVKFTIQKYPFSFDLGVLWLILGESIDNDAFTSGVPVGCFQCIFLVELTLIYSQKILFCRLKAKSL